MRPNRLEQIKKKQAEDGIDPTAAPKKAALAEAIEHLSHYQTLMQADLTKISLLKNMEERAELKKALLPQYSAFVKNYIDEGHDYPNDVAVQIMIWSIDIDAVEPFMDLAMALIETGNQHMPARFKRQDLETFVCDAMYDWANELLKQQQSASPYIDQLAMAIDEDHWDVHPLCASKVFAIAAKHKELSGEYQEGVDLCDLAIAINPDKHGVKSLKERMESKLKA